MIAALVIGGVLLLAMIGVAWYGWVTLPADALVPIHFGTGAARPPMRKACRCGTPPGSPAPLAAG
jgi:hypothetical protein